MCKSSVFLTGVVMVSRILYLLPPTISAPGPISTANGIVILIVLLRRGRGLSTTRTRNSRYSRTLFQAASRGTKIAHGKEKRLVLVKIHGEGAWRPVKFARSTHGFSWWYRELSVAGFSSFVCWCCSGSGLSVGVAVTVSWGSRRNISTAA